MKEKAGTPGNEVLSRRMALYGYVVNLAASEQETHHFQELLSRDTEADLSVETMLESQPIGALGVAVQQAAGIREH